VPQVSVSESNTRVRGLHPLFRIFKPLIGANAQRSIRSHIGSFQVGNICCYIFGSLSCPT
jgi:hypothetical protein